MKKVWVFRHGPKESGAGKNVIVAEMALKNPEEIELTRRIAETVLKEQTFKVVFTSPLVRAYQTGVIFTLKLGMDYPRISPGLAGLDLKKWEEIMPQLKGYTCVDFYEVAPELLKRDGSEVFKSIILAAEAIAPDEQALCISHGGLIEPAMATAISSQGVQNFEAALRSIRDLQEGEAVVFLFDDEDNFVGLEEKRLP